jgi:large subunit ribosomal protein L10
MLRAEKEDVVAELAERLRSAGTLIIADYRGLTHAELDDVRGELLKHGARFTVVKNTLTKRAADVAGVDALHEFLTGPTAIAFVYDGDMVAVAKTLNETAKATRRLDLKGGVLDGKAIDAGAVRDLATLPPLEQLRGQVLGAVVAPLTSLVGLIAAPLHDLVGLVDARIAQLDAGADADAPATEEEEPPAAEEEEPPATEGSTGNDVEEARPENDAEDDSPAAEPSAEGEEQ